MMKLFADTWFITWRVAISIATCVVDSNQAETFDNKTYPLELGDCWHVMFHYDPSIDNIYDNDDGISVLVRDASSYLNKKVRFTTPFFQFIKPLEHCMKGYRNLFEINKSLKNISYVYWDLPLRKTNPTGFIFNRIYENIRG